MADRDDAAGDSARLEALLDRHGGVIRRAVARVAPRGVDPDDVEQEVRIRLWKALRRERSFERAESYLYRMAVNATLDAVQRLKRRREEPLDPDPETAVERQPPAPEPSPERATAHRQLLAKVERALDELGENRAFCVRCHLQGLTTRETAALQGWTEAKARNLTYRGLDQLRRLLTLQGLDGLLD